MDLEQKANIDAGARLVTSWEDPEHVRTRIQPRRSDVEYPVLSDLNEFIQRNGSQEKITVLDFGAGSSPYKVYFPNADYRRADIMETPGLRYLIGTDSRIAEEDGVFDLILSTQVLEHVADVKAYLAESFRLLKKGGTLLLTTHGIWEEHGVPYDFQRWTEGGLKRDLKSARYNDAVVYKLTCGLRAALFLFLKGLFEVTPPPIQPNRVVFKLFREAARRIFHLLYALFDQSWPDDKIVEATPATASKAFYIVIAAIARK